jgi:hypothetical protein
MTAWQEQRQLDEIEAELAASTPRLAGMLRMFTRLTEGERPCGMERFPKRARRLRDFRSQPGLVGVLVLMAAVVPGALLAVLTHPGPRQCLGLTVTSQAATGSLPGTFAEGSGTPAGGSVPAAGTAGTRRGSSIVPSNVDLRFPGIRGHRLPGVHY